MKKTIHRFSKLEINTIFQLRASGLKIDEITKEINKRFNSNRTEKSISCKLSDLTKRDSAKEVKKLTELDEKLIEAIKNSPTNISYAIKKVAKENNVSFTKLQCRYYKRLKHINTILTVGSKIGFSKNNVKNLFTDINGNLPEPGMSNIQWLLKNILNLSEQERKQLIQILNS